MLVLAAAFHKHHVKSLGHRLGPEWIGEQPVDQTRPLVFSTIREELLHLLLRGNTPRKIQCGAPKKFRIRSGSGQRLIPSLGGN